MMFISFWLATLGKSAEGQHLELVSCAHFFTDYHVKKCVMSWCRLLEFHHSGLCFLYSLCFTGRKTNFEETLSFPRKWNKQAEPIWLFPSTLSLYAKLRWPTPFFIFVSYEIHFTFLINPLQESHFPFLKGTIVQIEYNVMPSTAAACSTLTSAELVLQTEQNHVTLCLRGLPLLHLLDSFEILDTYCTVV